MTETETRRCKRCGVVKGITEFGPNGAWRRGMCRECKRAVDRDYQKNVWRPAHPGYHHNLYFNRPDTLSYKTVKAEYNRQKLIALRKTIHARYGEKCSCCGAAGILRLRWAAAGPDPIAEVSRKNYGHYIWLVKNGLPDGFTFVCKHCWRKNGECPRKHPPPGPGIRVLDAVAS